MIGAPGDYSAWATDEKALIDHGSQDDVAAAVAAGELTAVDAAAAVEKALQKVETRKAIVTAKRLPVSKLVIAGVVGLGIVALLARRRKRVPAGKSRTPMFRVKGSLKLI